MRINFSTLAAMLLVFAGLVPFTSAQNVPTGFIVETLVSSGLSAPHGFAFTPDGRILIFERSGGIKVYAGGGVSTVCTVSSVETSKSSCFDSPSVNSSASHVT